MAESTREPKQDSSSNHGGQQRTNESRSPAVDPLLSPRVVGDPSRLSPQDILSLQRTIGNRSVQRIFAAEKPKSPRPANPMQMLQRMQAEHSRLAAKPSNSSSLANFVQRSYELNKPKDVKVTQDHRAKEVRVSNLKGESLGLAANSPTISPFGWDELKDAGHTLRSTKKNSSHYNAVRMHLWNGRLGGPGDKGWNLAPGPSKINSMMSAGPEMAAKLLVDAGYAVWLHTKVSYMNDSTNANDFTSVVPNRIDMEWGVMGQKALGSWGTDIELPVQPLSGPAAQEYKDWEKGKTSELVRKLSSVTDQVRAQAYDLVQHDELRLAILKAYPQIYLGMDTLGQGGVLQKMPDPMLLDFMKNILDVMEKPELLVEQVVFPLAESGAPLRAQKIFATLSRDDQHKTIVTYKWDLLQHLGAIAENFSTSDWTIFQYNPLSNQDYLLEAMERTDQLNDFLAARTRPQRKGLFDLWAIHNGNPKPLDRLKFVQSYANIDDKYKRGYEKAIQTEERSRKYREEHGLGVLKPRTIRSGARSLRTTNKTVITGRVSKTTTNRFKKRKATSSTKKRKVVKKK